ncbi:MAG: iron ABC transporter permease [Seleniivibrio sp.]|nr:iron ABC transporter permease [Seleniivibrio sp.]MCD8553501.1 iron ABC transporter permease [Seleniivibrio sp.]
MREFSDSDTKRRLMTGAAGLMLLAAGFVVSVITGTVDISMGDMARIFTGVQTDGMYHVLMNIRLPRIITGAFVGVNLALSGAILQAVLKNPLADPGIVGVTAGAGLFAMAVMILLPSFTHMVPPAAFAGALVTSLVIYFLAYDGGAHPLRLILAGVALAAFLGAFMSCLTVLYSDRVQGTVNWMAGSLSGKSWIHVKMILPYTLLGLFGAGVGAKYLNILMLGDDVARGLGLSVERIKFLLTMLAALLAASAVSVAGLLGFVGLIVPHITRLIIGSDNRFLIPFSAVFGGIIVIFADTAARVVFAPYELPVGVVMAFVGAPFFLYLLSRSSRS